VYIHPWTVSGMFIWDRIIHFTHLIDHFTNYIILWGCQHLFCRLSSKGKSPYFDQFSNFLTGWLTDWLLCLINALEPNTIQFVQLPHPPASDAQFVFCLYLFHFGLVLPLSVLLALLIRICNQFSMLGAFPLTLTQSSKNHFVPATKKAFDFAIESNNQLSCLPLSFTFFIIFSPSG